MLDTAVNYGSSEKTLGKILNIRGVYGKSKIVTLHRVEAGSQMILKIEYKANHFGVH